MSSKGSKVRPKKLGRRTISLLAIGAVLAAAGVAIAVGAAFYFLPIQHGTYTGPRLPYSTHVNSAVSATPGSYGAQGVHFNTTSYCFNATSVYSSPFDTVESGLMNQTYYGNLINNTGIQWLIYLPDEGAGGGGWNYCSTMTSPSSIYMVWIQEGDNATTFYSTITVTAL